MSYYIIPKIVNTLHVEPTTTASLRMPYLSRSLCKYYFQIQHQLDELLDVDLHSEDTLHLVNPYAYLYTKVPGSQQCVSKLAFKTNVFYDLLELKHNLNLLESPCPIRTLHVSLHHEEAIACVEMARDYVIDTTADKHCGITESDVGLLHRYDMYDFIYYETDAHNCVPSFLNALMTVLRHLSEHGVVIINVGGIFDKLVVDGIFLLSSLFQKVYISKPSPNSIATFNKYVICKGFHCTDEMYLHSTYTKLHLFCHMEDKLGGLFDYDAPCYFRNKLDEVNVIIGQQQLESLEMILSVYRNKNRYDKIENIKKANIQKSVLWCEKYRIPCNRFSGKVNIFLPVVNDDVDT